MKKYLILLTAFVFLAWLLPLGYFIKPSQEKIACDGQRAVCLCRVAPALQGKPIDGVVLKASAASHKDEGAAKGGANNLFLASQLKANQDINVLRRFEQAFNDYKNPHLTVPERIPLA